MFYSPQIKSYSPQYLRILFYLLVLLFPILPFFKILNPRQDSDLSVLIITDV